MEFSVMRIVLFLGIILFATKFLGILMRKMGLPQVVGMVLAGLLIGPAIFSQLPIGFAGFINPTTAEMDSLQAFSQVGVILILFSSGLETDFNEVKKSGLAATMIALGGVVLPMGLGLLGTVLFMGGFDALQDPAKLMNALFIGCIMTATSVGITVETLRELGKLNTKIGTTILSAAIIDDVLGIIALSMISALQGDGNVWITILKAIGFFVFTIGIGYILRKIFKKIQLKHPHARRTGIWALVMCFVFAFCAEEWFGIAAITGAYMAGLMLSGMQDTSFVDRKVLISGYMIFTPIFFAYIGISADFSGFKLNELWFGLVFVALAIIGKIVACALTAKAFRYKTHESVSIGVGMIARGEVALAVYSAGKHMIVPFAAGGVDPLVGVILLIVISSIMCPVLLKISLKNKTHDHHENHLLRFFTHISEGHQD